MNNIEKKYIRRGIRATSVHYKNKIAIILLSNGHMRSLRCGLAILQDEEAALWDLLEENLQVKEAVDIIANSKRANYGRMRRRLLANINKLAKYQVFDITDRPHEEYY